MLPFPKLQLECPDTLDQLVALTGVPGSKILAGGTDLMPSLKHRLLSADVLVSLGRVECLEAIEQTDAGLRIGATARLWDVARHPAVMAQYPALSDACRTVATSTIQIMGTLGGNVMLDVRCRYFNQPDGWRESIGGCLKCEGQFCHVARTGTGCYAAHSADTVPVLWLMDAELELVSSSGQRTMKLQDLYSNDGLSHLQIQPGEVLTAITLPPPTSAVVHRKLRLRGAIDYPALLVAVQRQGAGAKAVISAVGPSPIGVQVDKAEELAEAAWAAAKPLNTHVISTAWRRQMVRVEVSRALSQAPQ